MQTASDGLWAELELGLLACMGILAIFADTKSAMS
jgi:hypothetical protein